MNGERPSVARVYDYYLGGTANRPVDREFGDTVLARFPLVREIALANRLFLHRAVRYLIRHDIRQFVDIGSGIPTMGGTHSVADELAPGAARVVYVDNEPDAVAQSRSLIARDGDPARHAAVHSDLREPDRLWHNVFGTRLLDEGRPVGLLMIAVLHVRQPGAGGVDSGPDAVARYRALLPAGSYLAISHATKDGIPGDLAAGLPGVGRMYDTRSSPAIWRTRQEIAGLFGDFEIIPPGVTWTPLWHPEETGAGAPTVAFDTPNQSIVLAGIGRKQGPVDVDPNGAG